MWFTNFFMPESPGPERPPVAFRFCAFSSTPAPTTSERCPHFILLQPKEGA